jgi:hypothetical protein
VLDAPVHLSNLRVILLQSNYLNIYLAILLKCEQGRGLRCGHVQSGSVIPYGPTRLQQGDRGPVHLWYSVVDEGEKVFLKKLQNAEGGRVVGWSTTV